MAENELIIFRVDANRFRNLNLSSKRACSFYFPCDNFMGMGILIKWAPGKNTLERRI